MKQLFLYNWQVRDEWFDWCGQLNDDEWAQARMGGLGTFPTILFHIVDTEICWIMRPESYTFGEIMRHIIAHEIHHIGQLSVWSQQLGKKPVSANVIGRKLPYPQIVRNERSRRD